MHEHERRGPRNFSSYFLLVTPTPHPLPSPVSVVRLCARLRRALARMSETERKCTDKCRLLGGVTAGLQPIKASRGLAVTAGED